MGTLFILSGIVLNEWAIKYLSGNQSEFNTLEKSLFLLLFQIVLVAIGIYLYITGKKAAINLFILFITLLLIAVIAEVILSMSYFHDLSSPRPLWVPQKYKDIGAEINERHRKISLNNKYGFNDKNYEYKKNDTAKLRIAVLGDSFVWGAAVLDSVIWTNKLEHQLNKRGFNTEIMNWGIPGWSTLDQFNFLKEEGYKYDFDLLIFGFVVNDPVMDSSDAEVLIHTDGFVYRKLLKPAVIFFPNTVAFSVDLLNNFSNTWISKGYSDWLKEKVYQKNNLERYAGLLKNIKAFCLERNIKFIFVMTPENHSKILKKYFDLVESLLTKNDIPHYNLFPIVEEKLGDYSARELWATPADGHPNGLVTDVYADAVFDYLMNNNIIKEVYSK